MSTITVILIAIAVMAIAFGIIMYLQKERTRRLQGKFGPEYDRLAKVQGNHEKSFRLCREHGAYRGIETAGCCLDRTESTQKSLTARI